MNSNHLRWAAIAIFSIALVDTLADLAASTHRFSELTEYVRTHKELFPAITENVLTDPQDGIPATKWRMVEKTIESGLFMAGIVGAARFR